MAEPTSLTIAQARAALAGLLCPRWRGPVMRRWDGTGLRARLLHAGKVPSVALGVIDGFTPNGVEDGAEIGWSKDLLRKIGYKL